MALSFAVAVALLVGLVWLFDPIRVAAVLQGADPWLVGAGIATTGLSLVAWSETQRSLVLASGASLPAWRGFAVYNVGMFAKQVLPMGHAAGPALSAYALGTAVDRPYGENLAPASVAEFLGLAASLCVAVLGLAMVATHPATGPIRALRTALFVTVGGLFAAGLAVWYRRRTVEWSLLGMAWCLRATVGRLLPWVGRRATAEAVSGGLSRYYASLGTVTGNRRRVAAATAWALVGWVAFSLPLATCTWALDADLSLGLAFALAPVAGIAGLLPLPGGLGSSEIALTGLLTAVGGLAPPVAVASALLYRLCTYVFVVAVGAAFSIRGSATPVGMSRDGPSP